MKKKFKFMILILSCLFIFPMFTNAWDEIGSGGGTPTPGTGQCAEAEGCCFCRWNNAFFGSVKMTIVYYDGVTRYKLGNDVAYARGTNDSWIQERIRGVQIKNWLPYDNIINHPDYHSALKNVLLSNTQKANDYPIIREIFRDASVDYDSLLSAAKYKSSFYDPVNGRSYEHIINQKIGSNGTATKGIRIVVEPIFVIRTTGYCPSFSAGIDYAMTTKNLMNFAYNRGEAGNIYINNFTMTQFSQAMYVERGDIGYYPVHTNSLNLGEVSNPNSGWGLNIYGPFDDIPTYCDPDKQYDGYSSGVAYCCITENISVNDQSRNKIPQNGGNMKRPLTDYELRSTKECNKNYNICNPDKDGVAKCCEDFNITPATSTAAQQALVDQHKLTRIMTPQELLTAGCDDDGPDTPPGDGDGDGGKGKCNYYVDYKAPATCGDGDTTGKVVDIANWDCIFASTKSKKENVSKNYYEGDSYKNSYCAVYCKEEVNYSLPDKGIEVYSGRFLLVGNVESTFPSLSPITYKGVKTCRVTGSKNNKNGEINVSKFLKDIDTVDDAIRTAWDEWKIWQTQQDVCNQGGTKYYNGAAYQCESNHPNYSTQIAASKAKYESLLSKRNSYVNQINACSEFAQGLKYNFNPEVTLSYTEKIYGYKESGELKKWTLKQTDVDENSSIAYYNGGDATSGTSNSSSPNAVMTSVAVYSCSGNTPCVKNDSVKYPNTTWWEKKFTKNINFGLPDGTYQYISKATAQSFDSMAEAGGENSVDLGVANLPIHFSTMAGRYNFTVTTKSFGEDHKFNKFLMKSGDGVKFGDNTYKGSREYTCKFTVKCDKQMITTNVQEYCEICGEQVRTCNKKLCDPNEDPDECMPCDPEKDTCNECSNPNKPKDPTPSTPDKPKDPTPSTPDKPSCPTEEPTPTPGDGGDNPECKGSNCKSTNLDINLIFRPISLYSQAQAFPGKDGGNDGRKPGENWYSNNGSIVNGYIVNARNVNAYNIYKESPMYEITLTPNLMKDIRKYNKTQNGKAITIYDNTGKSHTGIAGYSDYDSMVCKGNGKKCLSTAIRNWGVTGCGITENFDGTKYNKCSSGVAYAKWGLND